MKIPRYTAAWLLCALLTGCASLGLTPAKTLSERLAYSYGAQIAVQEAATRGLNAGTLSSADGEYVLKVSDETRVLLDAARIASGNGDVTTAEGRLALAISILDELEAWLTARATQS